MSKNNYQYDDYDLDHLHILHTRDYGFSMPLRHLHSQYEFLFVLDGDVCIESNASSFTVNAPTLVVHKPFSLHRANTNTDELYERFVINITEELLSQIKGLIPNFGILSSAGCTVLPLETEKLPEIMKELIEIHANYDDNKRERLLLRFALLLLNITDDAVEKTPYVPDTAGYISDVIKYINAHYADDIKIDELADYFFVSRSKLISDFKRSMGVPIKKYTMFVRISNAQSFLNEGKSITETASLCGFYDNSHFISSFRQLTGSTPKEYKRKTNT